MYIYRCVCDPSGLRMRIYIMWNTFLELHESLLWREIFVTCVDLHTQKNLNLYR